MICLPFETAFIDRYPSPESWATDAPRLIEAARDEWNLRVGASYSGGVSGSVVRVTTAEGRPAVLKLGFPHREGVWEAVGLAALPSGIGPAVLRQDPSTWAMLLETIEPGIPLRDAGVPEEDALQVAGELHRRMRTAPVARGIPTLRDAWAPDFAVADQRVHTSNDALVQLGVLDLIQRAIAQLDALVNSDTAVTLLHGDFNPGNILLGEDHEGAGAWKLIDPKPMVGDPAFDLWPLVSQIGTPFDAEVHLARNVELASAAAAVDPARVSAWGFALAGINLAWESDEAAAAALRLWAALAP